MRQVVGFSSYGSKHLGYFRRKFLASRGAISHSKKQLFSKKLHLFNDGSLAHKIGKFIKDTKLARQFRDKVNILLDN